MGLLTFVVCILLYSIMYSAMSLCTNVASLINVDLGVYL